MSRGIILPITIYLFFVSFSVDCGFGVAGFKSSSDDMGGFCYLVCLYSGIQTVLGVAVDLPPMGLWLIKNVS